MDRDERQILAASLDRAVRDLLAVSPAPVEALKALEAELTRALLSPSTEGVDQVDEIRVRSTLAALLEEVINRISTEQATR